MVSKVEFETIDTRSLELESSISHMTIIFEVRTIYRLRIKTKGNFIRIFLKKIIHGLYFYKNPQKKTADKQLLFPLDRRTYNTLNTKYQLPSVYSTSLPVLL